MSYQQIQDQAGQLVIDQLLQLDLPLEDRTEAAKQLLSHIAGIIDATCFVMVNFGGDMEWQEVVSQRLKSSYEYYLQQREKTA